MPPAISILWVSTAGPATPEANLRASLEGFTVEPVPSATAAFDLLETFTPDAVLAHFPLAGWSPEEFLAQLQQINPSIPVILADPEGGLEDAVRLTRLGAYHYFGKCLNAAAVAEQLENAVEHRRSQEPSFLVARLSAEPWRKWLVGESRAMQKVVQIIRLVGSRRCTVLICGETGTGKEMAARALHAASPRAHLPMVTVNCSALPENLLEAELFGHVKGAFTGAVNHRIGRFEQAHGSTLFLDEIGDLPLELQVKLLRVLQEREFQRLGSSETIRVDIRVAAASNANLLEKVEKGKFREDLYYRLNVVPVEMPTLRERLSDIPMLAHHFIDKICRLEDIPAKDVGPETLDRLRSYWWPGNVRQLENAVEMAVALSGGRSTLYPGDFHLPASPAGKRGPATAPSIAVPESGLDFEQTVGSFERSILEQALRRTGGNKKKAADMLRLKRTTLSAKLRTLEVRSVYAAGA